ncbi:MAG TPA: hypothetical protein VF461_12885 [Gemmatimonadaceae bacterium]
MPTLTRLGWYLAALFMVAVAVAATGYGTASDTAPRVGPAHFLTADRCMPCHNSLTTETGEDASIGFDWRGSIMANASRDPYWQAGVRRETLDHPKLTAEIQDECSTCHMPMQRFTAHAAGGRGEVFAHLPANNGSSLLDSLSADGVSCTTCHQIQPDNFGQRSSFNGGFVIDTTTPLERRPIFGPYTVDQGHMVVMHSSTGFVPTPSQHLRESELCATCHTLYTPIFDSAGTRVGTLPEQMPFLEWKRSAYRGERSCQSCHMALANASSDSLPITSVNGPPRPELRRHWIPGGNFFLLGILNRYRAELAVEAQPMELSTAAAQTREFLGQAARLKVTPGSAAAGHVVVDVDITSLTGHKLPTAYPSRRAWLHVVVRDNAGKAVFESGAILPSGQILGNDNDDDRLKYEPHYREITRPDQVQIYESIMIDAHGHLTTGLLFGLRYVKDNRILPRGFDKATADADVAVAGDAKTDPGFTGGAARTRYSVDVSRARGPFRIDAELWYQPIGFRWAQNLRLQPSEEGNRFLRYYEEMGNVSAIVLARDSLTIR